jgi:hypothetical protein
MLIPLSSCLLVLAFSALGIINTLFVSGIVSFTYFLSSIVFGVLSLLIAKKFLPKKDLSIKDYTLSNYTLYLFVLCFILCSLYQYLFKTFALNEHFEYYTIIYLFFYTFASIVFLDMCRYKDLEIKI